MSQPMPQPPVQQPVPAAPTPLEPALGSPDFPSKGSALHAYRGLDNASNGFILGQDLNMSQTFVQKSELTFTKPSFNLECNMNWTRCLQAMRLLLPRGLLKQGIAQLCSVD